MLFIPCTQTGTSHTIILTPRQLGLIRMPFLTRVEKADRKIRQFHPSFFLFCRGASNHCIRLAGGNEIYLRLCVCCVYECQIKNKSSWLAGWTARVDRFSRDSTSWLLYQEQQRWLNRLSRDRNKVIKRLSIRGIFHSAQCIEQRHHRHLCLQSCRGAKESEKETLADLSRIPITFCSRIQEFMFHKLRPFIHSYLTYPYRSLEQLYSMCT